MKYLHRASVFILCLFMPFVATNAQKATSLKSFTISVPDTVIQGKTFSVTYILDATHWMNAHVTQGSGLTLSDVKSTVQEEKPYQNLIVQASFSTSRTGLISLPPMIAEIDGREVLSETKEVYVKPSPRYGEEMSLAHEWLLQKGADKDSLSLNFAESVGQFYFFCDQRHKCFCLVAKKEAWDYAESPVWAYSLESSMNEKSLKEFIPYFFEYYNDLLFSLKGSGQKARIFAEDVNQVSPLLGELKWGQGKPYNSKLPTKFSKNVVVGCVPLAMAMIMKYYEWPKQGNSSVYFEIENNKYNFDCTEIIPHWEQYKNQYSEEETEECTELSKILGVIALMMNPAYDETGTSANLIHTKHIMCNNLGYSGRMSRNDKLSVAEAYKLLEQELGKRRPCIVSRNGHAFVCDGCDGGFFHYNMGWKGHGNGYFRAVGGYEKPDTMFRTIITGIEPQKSEQKKEVTLKKAGTLNDLLSDEEKENLTYLTVSGPINGSDIRLIRAMAGAKGDSLYFNRDMGSLRKLNLAGARIVSDKTPWRIKKATDTWSYLAIGFSYSSTWGARSWDDYSIFNFNEMDKKQWSKFKSTTAKKAKKSGRIYSRVNDTLYIETDISLSNTIGVEMFSNCSSLYSIALPLDTKSIMDRAFINCESLKSTRIPASAGLPGSYLFQNCLSLEKLYVPKPSTPYSPYVSPKVIGGNISLGFKLEVSKPKENSKEKKKQ